MKPCSGVPGFSQVVLVGSGRRNDCHDEQGNCMSAKNENMTVGQSLIMTKQFLSGVPCTRGQLPKWRGNMSGITLPSLVALTMNSFAFTSLRDMDF